MAVIRVTPPIEETPIPQPDIEIVDGILKIGYIENQSDAFIQTDFSCGDDDKVKIEKEILYFDNTQNRYDGYNGIYFGIGKRRDTYSLLIQGMFIAPETETVKVIYNEFSQFTFTPNAASFQYSAGGGKKKTKYQSEFNIGNHTDKAAHNDKIHFDNLLLFKTDQERSNYKARLKTAKIYKNDVLVRDFVAAKRKADGKVGLFEKVESKFYTSPNGTEFIGG